MERLDFASITKKIRENLKDGYFNSQLDFAESLFNGYLNENDTCLDHGFINKCLNGIVKLSPAIISYYDNDKRISELALTIEDIILPGIADPAIAIQKLTFLLVQDPSISDDKKRELLGSNNENTKTPSVFVADLLVFGMVRPFKARDIRLPALPSDTGTSPMISTYIFDDGLPKPCPYFCGRDIELQKLHECLSSNTKIFLNGIPGIGKSELAKAYAKIYRKDYTNIIYLNYSGNLRADIIRLNFTDDGAMDEAEFLFERHDRFLRTLREDTLIIIDNFNPSPEGDGYLSDILSYRCRIIFTTRNNFSEHKSFTLEEITDEGFLFEIFTKVFSNAAKNQEVTENIIDILHRHTYAVVLAATLLNLGNISPSELLARLQGFGTDADMSDNIKAKKDGKTIKGSYYDHIRALFGLFELSDEYKYILRCMAYIPAFGIHIRLFGKWLRFDNINIISDVIGQGFIQRRPARYISLHPLIRELVISDLKPGIENTIDMLDTIRGMCQLHGITLPFQRTLYDVIYNILTVATKDNDEFYLRFLEDTFAYIEGSSSAMDLEQLLFDEMVKITSDKSVGNDTDYALIESFRSYLTKDPQESFNHLVKAASMIPEITDENALVLSNIHANLGAYYQRFGMLNEAKAHLEKAITILSKYELMGMHDSILQALNYSSVLVDMGDYKEALDLLLEVENIINHLDYTTFEHANTCHMIGITYLAMGRISEAKERFNQAMKIYAELFQDSPDAVYQKRGEISEHFLAMGLDEESERFLNG